MIHLKVRTEYSFRETFAPTQRVVDRLKAIGCTAAGCVDRAGSTWGHVRWEKTMLEAGLMPLFGAEVGVGAAPSKASAAPTAWFLATDVRAFYRLTSLAHKQATAGQPFLTTEQYLRAEGVERFTGAALLGNPDAAEAGVWVDVNPASPLQTNKALAHLRRFPQSRLVVTGDNFYPAPQDRKLHELAGRITKPTPQHILTEAEFALCLPQLSEERLRQARINSEEITARCASKLERAPLIKLDGDVEALCRAGQQERLAKGHITAWNETYEQRLLRELKLVREKEFDSYFLVVADMVKWAKQRMLVGPARGSAAGSLMCYLMGITEVDPIPFGLMFERFVDVTRKDLPDIDLDFPDAKRDSIYEYLRGKYGADHVARIGTVSEYKPKSALAEVAKRLRIPPWETQAVKDAMFVRSSGDSRANNCLTDTLNETAPGLALKERFPAIVLAGEIEGHASHSGVHAAGVIVCNEPVADFCTVVDGVAQLDKKDAEALGLLKVDVLGLRTLSVIEDAGVVTVEQLYRMHFDDPAVYALLNAGRFTGIFQWEGQALQSLTGQIEMRRFEDMVHITALARPGPLGGGAAGHFTERHAGRERVDVAHPSMLQYLEETFGLVLYQEQVMRMTREIGQFSWEDTAKIRKLMSDRKGVESFDYFQAKFIKGATEAVGLTKREAKDIWDQINSMGAWAFNKCAAGSTLVKIARTGGSMAGWMRLDELYDRYIANPSPWIKQRRSMPWLYSVHPDGRAYPHCVKTIHKNGPKPCKRYTFSDGTEVVCTEEHKFVINERWRRAGDSRIGDGWLMAELEKQIWVKRGSASAGKKWSWDGERHISPSEQNRRTAICNEFRALNCRAGCADCGQKRKRMEVHHNDFNEGIDRPHDLAWLCASCHKKRHYGAGRTKVNEKGLQLAWKELIAINNAGVVETYDVEMEAHHNYIINGGIVTHNSHSVSYAIVSYWTAWLKAHHPLQYAAAALRNAKDDETAFNMLREICAEGVEYVPFDPEISQLNWSVQDGRLVGGFLGLKGIGPATASAMIEQRAKTGGLTDKQRAKLESSKLIFGDLYPAHTMWKAYYDTPEAMGLKRGSRIMNIADILAGEGGPVLFIGQLKQKDSRDYNEAVRLAKRNGKRMRGATLFLDMRVMDDTSLTPLLCRIDRHDYEPTGRLVLERGREDHDWFLIRGEKLRNFPMVQIEKIRCLNDPDLLKENRKAEA